MSNSIKHAFRITHIKNIPWILKYGIVKADSPNRDENYIAIGDLSLINSRKSNILNPEIPANSIPFYFGPRSPMLYVIQNGYNGVKQYPPDEIVYLVINLSDIIDNDIQCVFTDGHAVDALTHFYSGDQLSRINELVEYDDVFAKFWFNTEADPDSKRRKEAELLVMKDLDPIFVRSFVVYNRKAKSILVSYGVSESKIFIMPSFYY